jgi:hypothetical protein
MYYDVPEGLGLRKIAGEELGGLYAHPGVMHEQNRIYNPLAAPFSAFRGFARGVANGRSGNVKNAPVIPQRPGIPAPADDPVPANQRPAGYGAGAAPSARAQKVRAALNGLSNLPVMLPSELGRHMYQQGQRRRMQRALDSINSGIK